MGGPPLPLIMTYYKTNVFSIIKRIPQEMDPLIYDRGGF